MSGLELNPCRYCGGEAKIRYDALPFGDQPMQADTSMALIECSRSNCVGQKGYRSTEMAIAAWNTRAPTIQDGSAPHVMGVKVKPLEWVKGGGGNDWRADTAIGAYAICAFTSDKGDKLTVRLSGLHISDRWLTTVEAAKADAQADYDARILAALPEVQAMIAEAVAQAFEDGQKAGIATEREACSKEALNQFHCGYPDEEGVWWDHDPAQVGREIAAAIRKRGEG